VEYTVNGLANGIPDLDGQPGPRNGEPRRTFQGNSVSAGGGYPVHFTTRHALRLSSTRASTLRSSEDTEAVDSTCFMLAGLEQPGQCVQRLGQEDM